MRKPEIESGAHERSTAREDAAGQDVRLAILLACLPACFFRFCLLVGIMYVATTLHARVFLVRARWKIYDTSWLRIVPAEEILRTSST